MWSQCANKNENFSFTQWIKQPLKPGASSNEMPISNSVTKDPSPPLTPAPHLIIDSILGCTENRAAIMILKVIFRGWSRSQMILYLAATSTSVLGPVEAAVSHGLKQAYWLLAILVCDCGFQQ